MKRESRDLVVKHAETRIAPHLYSELVNKLRDIAIEFHGTDQLRDVISRQLSEYIKPDHPHTREIEVGKSIRVRRGDKNSYIRQWAEAIRAAGYPGIRAKGVSSEY